MRGREQPPHPQGFCLRPAFPIKEEKPHLWLEIGQVGLNPTQEEAPRGLFTSLPC